MSKFISKKKYIIFALIFLITSLYSFVYYYTFHKIQSSPKVLIVYKEGTNGYTDIYQNYKQSYILNAQVTAIDDSQVSQLNLKSFDIVYPDVSLLYSKNINTIKLLLADYTAKGGGLFLEHEWKDSFTCEFTGVSSYLPNNLNSYNFTYPKVSYNLDQFQLIVKSFLDNFTEYRKDDLKFLKFKSGILNGAQSIADTPQGSLLSVNKYQKGYVLMTSNLLPNKNFITGFDFKAKNTNQEYFDYTFSTANYFARNEFLAFILKEKDGYVLKKVFGPYGRPAMAWQNHYEALSPIGNKEMVKWVDLLKDYNEIPSFSLVRSTYDWGQWKTDITIHLNTGTKESPKFIGESENSYYSSGQRLEGVNNYITFGDYPNSKSLGDPIELAYRVYPTIVYYNNDHKKDLVVGSPEGKLYLLQNMGTQNSPTFTDKEEIKLPESITKNLKYSAPTAYDVNKDGLFDLVVGNDRGQVQRLINNGSLGLPSFSTLEQLKDISGKSIKVDGDAAPTFGDVDEDSIDDLVLGSSLGSITLYKGSAHGFIYNGIIIQNNTEKFSTPAIYDWNHDGHNDILVGDSSGMIKVFLNNGSTFTYSNTVQGETTNPNGNKSLLGGHNSVPLVTDWNNDGNPDLLVGQLEFGMPYNIDGKFFPYKKELKESIAYAQSFGIPIYPHFLTHKFKSSEQEKKELALQKKSFEYYGLKWSGGIDQHTWRTNNLDPQQTLKSELNSGIWWNFGFNPPSEPDLPRDGKEFLWSTPFLLGNGIDVENFLTFTPSPNIFMYPDAYESFASLDMPITYFEHIEYAFSKQPEKLVQLKNMASFLDDTRNKGEYNFMTQDQMAKSFINTLYSKAFVSKDENKISLKQDLRAVPALAGEYKGTLGIKLEKGEKYKEMQISVSSPIQFEKNGAIYFGLLGNTKINFGNPNNKNFYIVRSNMPIEITGLKGTVMNLKFLSDGMQQIKIYSTKTLNIKGEQIKIQKEGHYYTVTHYGSAISIKVVK